MDRVNPCYVPRNQLVEDALTAAVDGDLAPYERLVDAVSFTPGSRPTPSRMAAAFRRSRPTPSRRSTARRLLRPSARSCGTVHGRKPPGRCRQLGPHGPRDPR